jgi:hypothetical protein
MEGIVDGFKWTAIGPLGKKHNPFNLKLPKYTIDDEAIHV